MKILLIEPYYTGSHKQWADDYRFYSDHEVKILSMKGQFWKWRMHIGAVTIAKEFNEMKWQPDVILSTDMLDLTTFLALTKKRTSGIPTAIYFHENQLSYPWSHKDRDIKNNRDTHYGFINYSSALAADRLYFNSKFHMDSFIHALKPFLKQFPDYQELETIEIIKNKSEVLYLGIDFKRLDKFKISKSNHPIIIWNHRWEYDKNPELFFKTLETIKKDGYYFNLVVLGENFSQSPTIFKQSKNTLEENIQHWGYAESYEEYASWLWKSHILPVTSNQEFFGVSVLEAIYCGIWPILPDRLSYPELIPIKNNKNNYYVTETELYNMIIWGIKNYKKIKKNELIRIAKPYDWSKMAPIYDRSFETI